MSVHQRSLSLQAESDPGSDSQGLMEDPRDWAQDVQEDIEVQDAEQQRFYNNNDAIVHQTEHPEGSCRACADDSVGLHPVSAAEDPMEVGTVLFLLVVLAIQCVVFSMLVAAALFFFTLTLVHNLRSNT